jgi:hypothetical protein
MESETNYKNDEIQKLLLIYTLLRIFKSICIAIKD